MFGKSVDGKSEQQNFLIPLASASFFLFSNREEERKAKTGRERGREEREGENE